MKIFLLIILINIYLLEFVHAGQNIFWKENFNHISSGCLPNSSPFLWSVSNIGTQGANANDWYIHYPVESHIDSCYLLNNDTLFGALYIGYGNNNCDSSEVGPFYKKGCNNTTNKRVESPVIDCSGKTGIILEFDAMAHHIFPNDFALALYSPNNGTTWDTLEYKINTGYCPSSTYFGIWKHKTFTLPSSADNNPNVKIGFMWANNDDCLGTEISVAIDNINLSIDCDIKVGISAHDFDIDTEFCAGSEYRFDANIGYEIDSIYWNFGNGQFSNDSNVEVTYLNPGNYLMELFVVDTNGCTGIETLPINVHGFVPSIGTSTNSVCPYECIDFSYIGIPISINGTPNNYSWKFYDGNPGISTDMNPQNCYTHTGNYNATLVVSNPNTSCTGSTSTPVFVDTCDYPVLSHIFTDPSYGEICVGDCIDFTSDAFNATSYNWSFPGASISTSSFSSPANVCYTNAGLYTVILTVSNGTGTTSLTRLITVHSPPPTPTISYMYTGMALTGLSSNISGFYHYEWYIDPGTHIWVLDPYSTFAYISAFAYLDYYYKLRVQYGFPNSCYSESNILFVPH